jgi:hypothetical protein
MKLKILIKESILKVSAEIFENNLTKMAKEIGVSYKQLQSYGIRCLPSCAVLNRFLKFGISSDYLLTGKGSMFADNKAGQELKLKYDKQYENGQYKIVSVEYLNNLTELMRKIK